MQIIYRKAEQKDAEGLKKLLDVLSKMDTDIMMLESKIGIISKDDTYFLLVACEGDEVAGSAMGVLCHDYCGGSDTFMVVENVIVSENHRRMGIAKMLFFELENWARHHECGYSILVSGSQRKEAHILYETIGYQKEFGFRKYFK